MAFFSAARGFSLLLFGLKDFLREPLTLEAARESVRTNSRNREGLFLDKIRRGIFRNPRSPYGKLLRNAGCELADVEKLVNCEGVEGCLVRLMEAGIYVSFDEFKGRSQAVRGSQTFTFGQQDFDNHLIPGYFTATSGGSRSAPARVRMNLADFEQSAPHWALWFETHGWLSHPLIFWTSAHTGMASRQIKCAKFGKPFDDWFIYSHLGGLKERLIATVVHSLIRRRAGFSRPKFLRLQEAERLGDYLLELSKSNPGICVNTTPSAAVRISVAMGDRGLSLSRVSFLLGAEPLTPSRKAAIESCGAKAVPSYGFTEGGWVGCQCPNPSISDDVHVFSDAYAVIQLPAVPSARVRPFFLTSLRPACPKVLLNTDIGDVGVIERRNCGCLLDDFGYQCHLQSIRSSQKITCEGVTVLAADLYEILEEKLPARFGGHVTDYQLVQEGRRNLSSYVLRVSPLVGRIDGDELLVYFAQELRRTQPQYRFLVDLWLRDGSLRIERNRPLASRRGKVLPFHLRSDG